MLGLGAAASLPCAALMKITELANPSVRGLGMFLESSVFLAIFVRIILELVKCWEVAEKAISRIEQLGLDKIFFGNFLPTAALISVA